MERVRFPVVLFDLDGTLIDSGPMIVASMKHAAKSVLGREIPEEVLSAAVGGPGLVAQMQALAPTASTTSSRRTGSTTSRCTTSWRRSGR
jgi:beta-phosphoglucomutase-like phosphatase (HAD superfamily)